MINKKIIYKENNYYEVPYNGGLLTKITPGYELIAGEQINSIDNSDNEEKIKYSGRLVVEVGAEIERGDVISKSTFTRKNFTAPFSGRVVSIDKGKKEIILKSNETQTSIKPIKAPFKSKVIKMLDDDKLLVEFAAVNINLIDVKGQLSIGKLKYISLEDLKKKLAKTENLAEFEGCILLTETITSELYPKLSALGIAGLVLDHIEYSLFSQIVTLRVPIGVISGYGNLNFDEKIKKFLIDREGAKTIIDVNYKKLLVLDETRSSWLNNYEFDLAEAGIISKG